MPNDPPTSLVPPALMLFEPEMLGEQVLHHVRSLRPVIDGEPLVARVPVRHDGARLVGHAGVATEHEGGLDHVGLAQTPVRIAGHVHARRRGCRRARDGSRVWRGRARLGVGDGRQLFVADLDQLAASSASARLRHDGADRLALPAGALDSDRVLRRRLEALEMGEHADPGVITLARSAPVTTAMTPVAFLAAAVAIAVIAHGREASARRPHASCAAVSRR